MAKYPIEKHDNVTVNLMNQFGYLLQQWVAGEDMAPALEDGLRVFNKAMLDESRGEAYHKETTAEKKRAPASTSKRLKQCTRSRASMKFSKTFKQRYGAKANDVIRFEWTNYKRVLRPSGKQKWKPVPMKCDDFYSRLYREDRHAEFNWNAIVSRAPAVNPVVHAEPTAREKLENEYVVALVEPGNHYSVMRANPAPAAGGEPTRRNTFQVA